MIGLEEMRTELGVINDMALYAVRIADLRLKYKPLLGGTPSNAKRSTLHLSTSFPFYVVMSADNKVYCLHIIFPLTSSFEQYQK